MGDDNDAVTWSQVFYLATLAGVLFVISKLVKRVTALEAAAGIGPGATANATAGAK